MFIKKLNFLKEIFLMRVEEISLVADEVKDGDEKFF